MLIFTVAQETSSLPVIFIPPGVTDALLNSYFLSLYSTEKGKAYLFDYWDSSSGCPYEGGYLSDTEALTFILLKVYLYSRSRASMSNSWLKGRMWPTEIFLRPSQ